MNSVISKSSSPKPTREWKITLNYNWRVHVDKKYLQHRLFSFPALELGTRLIHIHSLLVQSQKQGKQFNYEQCCWASHSYNPLTCAVCVHFIARMTQKVEEKTFENERKITQQCLSVSKFSACWTYRLITLQWNHIRENSAIICKQ